MRGLEKPEECNQLDAEKENNFMCFYHCDMDGRAGAITLGLMKPNEVPETNFREISDHAMVLAPLISDFFNPLKDIIYVIDLAYQNSSYDQLKILYEKCHHRMVWIDHHSSSIELQKNHPELKEIPGIRCENFCGAVDTLAYCGLTNLEEKEETGVNEHNSVLKYYTETAVIDYINMNPPIYVNDNNLKVSYQVYDYIDSWDRFVNDPSLKSEETWFNYGFNKFFEEKRKCNSEHKKCANFTEDDLRSWANIFFQDIGVCKNEYPDLHAIMKSGKQQCDVIANDAANELKNVFTCNMSIYDSDKNIDMSVSVLCLNTQRNNTIILHDIKKNFDLICLFRFNGSQWSYGLYSGGTIKSSLIDCSKIAEFYGGGGHKGAAGWVSRRYEPLDIWDSRWPDAFIQSNGKKDTLYNSDNSSDVIIPK
jgi:hypothetical protein